MSEMSNDAYPLQRACVRLPSMTATAQHIGVMQRKLDQLHQLRDEAWAQVLTTAARGYVEGAIDDLDLVDMLADMKASYGAGYTVLWNQHMPWKASQVPHRAAARSRNAPNGAYDSWIGEWPDVTQGPYPEDRVAVVYVLYDHLNRPAYVGSTETFRYRMSCHRSDWKKRSIARWTAYRCADREAAYVLEERLLAEHKPYLNKRRTR